MDEGHGIPHLREAVIFLVAAGILVPVLHRLRISPVLGYLLVGALVGPFGLGLLVGQVPWLGLLVIDDLAGVQRVAELGVIFLLFVIGLELSFERLWAMRRWVFGLGSLQVLISALVIGAVAWGFGNSPAAATVLGACLALSSTAIVMQLLSERHQLGTSLGRSSFSILLLQDLAVVPILFLVGALGAKAGEQLGLALLLAFGKALLAITLIYAAGRVLLRPLMRLVARTRSAEMFMAAILLVAIGTSVLTELAGLSMALGAFLAGLLLAETEYRHEIEVHIEPFKGLLLGLFFMSVGMGIDYRVLGHEAFWILSSVAGLILLKATITAGLCLAFGLPRHTAVETGLLLGQGGEFAFVVIGLALGLGLVPLDVARFMLIVAGLSMLATPLVAALARRLGQRLEAHARQDTGGDATIPGDGLDGHVLVAGYGRVGQSLVRVLDQERIPWIALDLHPDHVAKGRAAGQPVYYGDASKLEILRRASLERAQALAITMDDSAAAERIVKSVRTIAPGLPIHARARDAAHARRLLAAGASEVVPETVEASLQLAAVVLAGSGMPEDVAQKRIEVERDAELQTLRRA